MRGLDRLLVAQANQSSFRDPRLITNAVSRMEDTHTMAHNGGGVTQKKRMVGAKEKRR